MYSQWRERIGKARDNAAPVFTPRGNSLKVNLGGITERAAEMLSPRVSTYGRGSGERCGCLTGGGE